MLKAIKQKSDSLDQLVEDGVVNVSLLNDFNWLIEQAEKVETLQAQLDAKLVFINNGWEEERYALQEDVLRLERDNKALKNLISADVKQKKMREERNH